MLPVNGEEGWSCVERPQLSFTERSALLSNKHKHQPWCRTLIQHYRPVSRPAITENEHECNQYFVFLKYWSHERDVFWTFWGQITTCLWRLVTWFSRNVENSSGRSKTNSLFWTIAFRKIKAALKKKRVNQSAWLSTNSCLSFPELIHPPK